MNRTTKFNREIVDLERPIAWPSDLRRVLVAHQDALCSRHIGSSDDSYDAAIDSLVDALKSYSVVGWHCTRLTQHEVDDITVNGMALLDIDLVSRRVDAAIRNALLTPEQGARLKTKNQAGEQYRAGMLWFCFFTPAIAGESGIGDLLRFWGGEAVYNSHDQDEEMGSLIAGIGKPAIVEAEIPIEWCGGDRGLRVAMNIGQRFVVAQGIPSGDSCVVEDNIKRPLPAELIRNVYLHPTADFLRLTDCRNWNRQL